MLGDPEAPSEIWTDYVWAENETEAMRKCQIKAEQATVEGKKLVKLVDRPRKVGKGKRYECTFAGELP
jgi:hypothetical protein